MRIFFTLVLLFLVWPAWCLAQKANPWENWLDLTDEGASVSQILQDLQENPVAVNSAGRSDWRRIPLLPEGLIDKILKVRKQKGPFKTLRQLKAIVGPDWYQRLRPFVILNAPKRTYFYWLQRNSGFLKKPDHTWPYSGDAWYNYSKIRIKYNNHLQAALLTEKDSGEPQWMDYFNGYVQYVSGRLRLIAGSFYMQLGQGLLLSSPFGQMKSALVTLPFSARKDRAAPYLGSAENLALTGVFIRYKVRAATTVRLLYTRTLRDGQFNSRTGRIIGFDYSGYHRTRLERMKKDLIAEQIRGINLTQEFAAHLLMGVSALSLTYNPAIAFTAENVSFDQLRRQYYHFKGSHLHLQSVYYRWTMPHLSIAGEWAISEFKHHAVSQVFFIRQTPFATGILLWQVNRDFQTPLGRVFDDHAPFPSAQQGVYAALEYSFGSGTFRFYKRLKKDLWRTYFEPMPKLKDEWFMQLGLNLPQVRMKMRLRRYENEAFAERVEPPKNKTTSLRLEMAYGTFRPATFRTRLEVCRLTPASEKGLALFQDIQVRFSRRLRIFLRLTFYRTHSFATRIYEYENDLPGRFANVALFGQGFKWYVLFAYRLSGHLRLWLKYRYQHLNTLDFNEISYGRLVQPIRRELRVQFEWRF